MLRWSDPLNSGAASSVVLVRASTNDFPATINEGFHVYTGTGLSFLHTNLAPHQTYFYTAWMSHDGQTFVDPP